MSKQPNRVGDHEMIENPDKRTIAQGNKEVRREQREDHKSSHDEGEHTRHKEKSRTDS